MKKISAQRRLVREAKGKGKGKGEDEEDEGWETESSILIPEAGHENWGEKDEGIKN